ncbi:Zinc finger FLYWCH type [Fasciola hepatica]|uniref:Zinc finger FLYWCH type n=1 Tax=Fasciola hepatica TaxID=6192 RepID=A0A4E0RDP2_FASHE|nr:Zinc finger FLYWCH type [Fasciola hepatica]
MHSTTQLYSPNSALDCAMVEAITPDSVTDGVSTEELDENLCNAVSPGLSDELADHNLGHLSNQLNPTMLTITSTGYSPRVHFTAMAEKNADKKWNLVKVRVGFDVTRKGERSLVIDGYKFTKSRDGIGDRVFWRCSRRECKATAVTVADKVEHIRAMHSHQPPVAAEFFADNPARSEQEVRFNNAATYSRSRVRRRNQNEPLEQAQQLSINASTMDTIPTNIRDNVHVECFESAQLTNSELKVFDHISSEHVSSLPSSTSINGFSAQTLTALITHLVETNPNSKPFRSPTSNRIELTSVMSTGQPMKVDSSCAPLPTNTGSYVHRQTDSVNNRIPAIELDDVPTTTQSGPSSLEQLAAIATSFDTSGTTVSCASGTGIEQPGHTKHSLSMHSVVHTSPVSTVSVSTDRPDTVNDHHSSAAHFQCAAAANVISPGTVGFIGKNSQGQLVVLSGEQLSEWLKIQQSQKAHNSAVCPISDESSSNVHSTGYGLTRSPSLTQQQCSVNTSNAWEHRGPPNLESQVRSNNREVNHWPSTIVSTTPDSRQILSRLDELPKSLPCIVSLSNKSPDSKLQPIMVTALQVQPPGSPVNSNLVPFHTFGLQSALSTSDPSKQITHSEGILNDVECASSVCVVNGVISPHQHVAIQQNSTTGPSPGLLVHWKKEKMRESVEEDGTYPEAADEDHSDVVHLSENPVTFTTSSGACLTGVRRPPTMRILDEEPLSKMCCCEDVTSNTFAGATSTTNSQSYSSVQPSEVFHLSCMESSTRHTPSSRNALTISVCVDEEETLCNQVQDGVLVKVLNTVQQLTAKLDADADPPEVIQNCRAIQACLDTIAAIKRVRSASGTCSPRTGVNSVAKPPASTTEVFTDSSRLSVTASIPGRLGIQGGGFQNSSVGHFMDSTHCVLPV